MLYFVSDVIRQVYLKVDYVVHSYRIKAKIDHYDYNCYMRIHDAKRLVINYGEEGYKMGKIVGPKPFAPPPPQPSRQVKTCCAPRPPPPHFKGWKLFAPPPLSPWLQLQARMLKLPQNFHARPPPPSSA